MQPSSWKLILSAKTLDSHTQRYKASVHSQRLITASGAENSNFNWAALGAELSTKNLLLPQRRLTYQCIHITHEALNLLERGFVEKLLVCEAEKVNNFN